jgi:hypothetical protein
MVELSAHCFCVFGGLLPRCGPRGYELFEATVSTRRSATYVLTTPWVSCVSDDWFWVVRYHLCAWWCSSLAHVSQPRWHSHLRVSSEPMLTVGCWPDSPGCRIFPSPPGLVPMVRSVSDVLFPTSTTSLASRCRRLFVRASSVICVPPPTRCRATTVSGTTQGLRARLHSGLATDLRPAGVADGGQKEGV